MNIYNEFRKTAINRYSKTALVMMNDEGETKEYTFGQTLQQADIFCSRLKAMGVVAGDRVCIASEGRPEWNIAFLACAKLNATAVLLDYSLPAAELVALVKKSQPVCVVASQKAAKKLTSVKNIPVLDIQNQLDRLDGSGENILRQGEVGDPDIAVIIFSSGTTRTASGIMHTHDSQINSCKMVCRCNGITDNERYLGILPNSHIYGLFAQVLAPLLTGGTVCFIESLSAKGLSAGFQNFKPTVFPGVPKVYELLKTQIMQQINGGKVSSALFKKMFPVALHQRKIYGINSGKKIFAKIHKALGGELRFLCSAGSPMSKDTFDFFYGTGFNIVNNYGATETSIPTIGTYGKHVYADTCGKAYPDIKVKIDRSGELLIKSPYMMIGYYGDKKSTDEAFNPDGWFKSGDLAKFDKHKNIVILGRCKENIVLSTGKKAAPDDLKEKQPVNAMDEVFEWAESFVFAMFMVILIFTFFFRIVLVQGPSMRETLQDQDRLIITHINYTPQKGDIVVINSEKLGKTIIKRVIGTGGDKVVVDYNNNTVTVNGKVISNDNIREAMYNTNLFDEKYEVEENVFEYDVPEDKLFVMGDNRNNSTDSRRIGFIDPSDVLGKAVLRLYPFDSFGKVS